ncbi:MAG: thiamine phosphate synthase [bacterium]|nr:thiamine phosphate synthase [bacterium]
MDTWSRLVVDPTDRILDANLNRAREALRVLEDYARLGLDDAALSGAAKTLRHRLASALQEAGLTELICARDISGDVGCGLIGDGEYDRRSLADVVTASGKRLTEALRVIEETGKTKSPAFGAAVEQIRYSAYDLERRLARRLASRRAFDGVRLYVLLTEALCAGEWKATAEAAIRGGASALQLREKHLSDRVLLDRARWLTGLCHEREVICLINDRPDIALLAGADGVHVGQDDLAASQARRILGSDGIVGVSTHTVEQARNVLPEEPDYLAVGPMFATRTKSTGLPVGPELWRAVRSETSLPIVAIGGIHAENGPQLLKLGCCCLCVCQAIIGTTDVEAAARRLRILIDESVSGEALGKRG